MTRRHKRANRRRKNGGDEKRKQGRQIEMRGGGA